MGLFDPPWKTIRKKLPPAAHANYDQFHEVVRSKALPSMSRMQVEMLVGFVTSVWVLWLYRAGRIPLSERDAMQIRNMGLLAGGRLKGDQEEYSCVLVEQLVHTIT